jgi:hypothetical protein
MKTIHILNDTPDKGSYLFKVKVNDKEYSLKNSPLDVSVEGDSLTIRAKSSFYQSKVYHFPLEDGMKLHVVRNQKWMWTILPVFVVVFAGLFAFRVWSDYSQLSSLLWSACLIAAIPMIWLFAYKRYLKIENNL